MTQRDATVSGRELGRFHQHADMAKSAQSGFQAIPSRIKPIVDRVKVIPRRFYPPRASFKGDLGRVYPITDGMNVIADGKEVLSVGSK